MHDSERYAGCYKQTLQREEACGAKPCKQRYFMYEDFCCPMQAHPDKHTATNRGCKQNQFAEYGACGSVELLTNVMTSGFRLDPIAPSTPAPVAAAAAAGVL